MRLEGWESRLDKALHLASKKPYVLGEHDCFRLTCSVVEALTGVDRWPEFSGYKTRKQALAKLAAFGASFEAAGDKFFGERIAMAFARRGDIAAVQTVADEDKHLGVVMGKYMYVLGETGLMAVPIKFAICFWKVG